MLLFGLIKCTSHFFIASNIYFIRTVIKLKFILLFYILILRNIDTKIGIISIRQTDVK